MKVIRRGLSKKEITFFARYEKWCLKKEEEKELLIMIDDEEPKNSKNELTNIINYKDNFVMLCVNDLEYCNEFYDNHKMYTPRLFIKNNTGNLYNEYALTNWELTDEGICLRLKK